MTLFKTIFGDSSKNLTQKSNINWITLTDTKQIDEIIALSFEKPVAVFKHSTRCSISRMALKQFENDFESMNNIETYLLDLIAYREVSNEISHRFGVIHQSPQLLLIKNGKSIYNESHDNIDAKSLI